MAGGWSNGPLEFIKVFEADLVKHRNEIAADALQMVVHGSPVDTGAYKGSHRISVNHEDLSAPITPDTGGAKTIAAGMKIIASAKQPFSMILIQTNLPYSESLENGHSGQAPAGNYGPAFASLVAKYGGG
ncbi:HK97 gp10 family phage protein [Pseudomonas sp. 21LCFQ02]|uniref:HK97 gp10 family phage protein n=1 Tax=Pseudomonas sp. 21LCFQ02 TaxID=2957505 RepID=UPI00209AC893|nr:HK97 gp10 family phage protein [Pseudomonas sp. 21LCFQ02]MCO8166835.1 HK97 gp10 family phage protein [Pseudomonas sp. 21LCFQ02]